MNTVNRTNAETRMSTATLMTTEVLMTIETPIIAEYSDQKTEEVLSKDSGKYAREATREAVWEMISEWGGGRMSLLLCNGCDYIFLHRVGKARHQQRARGRTFSLFVQLTIGRDTGPSGRITYRPEGGCARDVERIDNNLRGTTNFCRWGTKKILPQRAAGAAR
jgi:hypothetical protein